MFRLIAGMRPMPEWLLLENVPFMLSLDGGRAMGWLAARFAELGWAWAYRTVDTRCFGLPQRRRRVFILASSRHDPRGVLFADDAGRPEIRTRGSAYGFCWTEGKRGLGWAVDAVPPLRAGSGVGIPSPPAIWFPSTGEISTPDIRDAERLQGFPQDWTKAPPGLGGAAERARWQLVGNAVSVLTAEWIGRRIASPGRTFAPQSRIAIDRSWPHAAWGFGDQAFVAKASQWPLSRMCPPLAAFLRFPPCPLSLRATRGFRSRARQGRLRFRAGFLEAVDRHLEQQRQAAP